MSRVAAVTTGLAVAVVPVAGLVATAGSAHATTPKPTTSAAKPCKTNGALPAVVKGKPTTFAKGLPAGAWLWHDKRGYHLRVTHDSRSKLVFKGAVTSSAKVHAKRIGRSERNDVLWRNNKHTSVKFVLRNYGGVDGIDFTTNCAKTVTVTLRVAGQSMSTTQIHLGATAANPSANPVVITRTVAP